MSLGWWQLLLFLCFAPGLASDSGEAARHGEASSVQWLAEHGADMDIRDSEGMTPLMHAAKAGADSTVEVLLAHGASVDIQDEHEGDWEDRSAGWTALIYAARQGHASTVKVLVAHGASVDHEDAHGLTPLMHASRIGEDSVAKVLLAHGASVDIEDVRGLTMGMTALFYAALHGHDSIIEVLVSHGATLEHRDTEGGTALTRVAWFGHVATANVLVAHRANLDIQDEDGRTPLMYAAQHGHDSLAELLVAHGAKLDIQDEDGRTSLMFASPGPMAKVFVAHGASVHIQDKNGRTPLMYAASGPVAKVLVANRASVHTRDKDGRTALMYAASGPVAKVLVASRASVHTRDKDGRTALMYAASEAVAEFLVAHGASVHTQDIAGATPLMWAAEGGHSSTMSLLLSYGAHASHRDGQGRTLLHYAVMSPSACGRDRKAIELAKHVLGPDSPFEQDMFWQTPHDVAVSTSNFAALSLLPAQTTKQALGRLLGRWETYVGLIGCLAAVFAAARGTSSRKRQASTSVGLPSRGALILSGLASVSTLGAAGIRIFRVADMLSAAITLASLMFWIPHRIALPTLFLLYVVPALGVRTGRFNLAVWLSSVPASLPTATAWRRHEIGRTVFAALRMAAIWTLVANASYLNVDGGRRNAIATEVVKGLQSNDNPMVKLRIPPALDLMWLLPQPTFGCSWTEDACLRIVAPVCTIAKPQHGLTFVPNSTAGVHVWNESRRAWEPREIYEGNAVWTQFGIDRDANVSVCQMRGEVAVRAPSVDKLWGFAKRAGLAGSALALAVSVGAALVAAPAWHRSRGGGGQDMSPSLRMWANDRQALARHIDRIVAEAARQAVDTFDTDSDDTSCTSSKTVDISDRSETFASSSQTDHPSTPDSQTSDKHVALQELRGTSRAVAPLSPWAVRFTVLMLFVDVCLDLSTMRTFIMNEEVWFANCLTATCVYSMTSQMASGQLQSVLQDMRESAEVGKWTEGLLNLLDEERGVEAVVSLLISCYGLVFSVKTPMQGLLGILSIACGTTVVGNYLFNKLDLEGSWIEEEDEQEREVASLRLAAPAD